MQSGGQACSRIEIEWDLQHGASLFRHPYSRMAWRRAHRKGEPARLYVSGHDYPLPADDAALIADAAQLDGAGYASLSDAGRDLVQELIQSGHFNLALPDEEE